MSLVPVRSKKHDSGDIKNKTTYRSFHNEYLRKLRQEKKNVHVFEERLQEMKDTQNDLKRCRNLKVLQAHCELKNDIKKLEREIKDIKTGKKLARYILKSSARMEDKNNETEGREWVEFSKDISKNISSVHKNHMIDDFMRLTKNKSYAVTTMGQTCDRNCTACQSPMYIIERESREVCSNCGLSRNIMTDSDKPSFKEDTVETGYYAYKRINHFREHIAQYQARENSSIPEEVIAKLLVELKKERFYNLALLDYTKTRKILRKLRLNKYYEHIPQIMCKITGLPPPKITKEIEDTLCDMFIRIQKPFEESAPADRKNFLSYSYVLNKMTMLLNLHEFSETFPLLKSRQKLEEQDNIWKKICDKVGWEFHPSL